jgi:signal transduction histidine kinase
VVQVHYDEGVAIRIGPEPCAGAREGVGEASVTHYEAMKNRVSVQTQLAEGLPLIEGDRVQLQQVMLNLIINAVEE